VVKKITFRPERNFYGRPQRLRDAVNRAAVERELAKDPDEWFCNDCGFVPVAEIARESDEAGEGACKCGRPIFIRNQAETSAFRPGRKPVLPRRQ
jgi:hypothetical protein